jgi:hypothetical protein
MIHQGPAWRALVEGCSEIAPYLRAMEPKIKHDGTRRRPETAGEIDSAVIKMARCMAE